MSKYKYQKKESTAPTVEVDLPSGNVILMEKPSKYAVLFNMQAMPAALTEKAIKAWEEQGVGNEVEDAIESSSKADKLKLMEMSLKIRDSVLRLSREPKIVMGEAGEGQVSVDEISDDDLDFLFKWVASGGNAAVAVATFRGGRKQDAVGGAHGRKVRSKAVATGGVA